MLRCFPRGPRVLLLLTVLAMPVQTNAADDVDMSKVRSLAALPVKEALLAQLEQLDTMSREDLLEARYQRLVGYGAYRE